MSRELADRLIADEAALIQALDRGTAQSIDQASHRLATTLNVVAAAGGWRETPELRDTLKRGLALAEAAAARINFLADQARRRLETTLRVRGGVQAPSLAYAATGRMA